MHECGGTWTEETWFVAWGVVQEKQGLYPFAICFFDLSVHLLCACEIWALTHFPASESAPDNGSLRKEQDLALKKYKGLLAKQEQLLRGILLKTQHTYS